MVQLKNSSQKEQRYLDIDTRVYIQRTHSIQQSFHSILEQIHWKKHQRTRTIFKEICAVIYNLHTYLNDAISIRLLWEKKMMKFDSCSI
jgi:hypothetical protein